MNKGLLTIFVWSVSPQIYVHVCECNILYSVCNIMGTGSLFNVAAGHYVGKKWTQGKSGVPPAVIVLATIYNIMYDSLLPISMTMLPWLNSVLMNLVCKKSHCVVNGIIFDCCAPLMNHQRTNWQMKLVLFKLYAILFELIFLARTSGSRSYQAPFNNHLSVIELKLKWQTAIWKL